MVLCAGPAEHGAAYILQDKFHRGLRRNLLQTYIGHVNTSVNDALAKLTAQAAAAGAGGQGQFEIFSHMKHVVHRVGFLSWVGPEAASERYMQRLIDAFEALDPGRLCACL